MTPEYVPPHLAGQVEDFRQEPDGQISFRHDAMGNGLSDPELSRKIISKDQYKQTFDRNYRNANFNQSILNQYGGVNSRPKSYADALQSKIINGVRSGLEWGTSSGTKSVATTGLLSALAGGGLGAYMAAKNGDGIVGKSLLYALLAGAAGAGSLAYMHNADDRRRNFLSKQASSAEDVLIAAITSDRALNPAQQSDLIRSLVRLSSRDRDDLSRLVRTGIGAGAGVLIARFLMGKGLLSSAVGGMIGAAIGAASARPSIKYNAMGQVLMSNYR